MLAAVKAHQDSDRAMLDPCAEFVAYIKSPLELMDNVVGWWGVVFNYIALASAYYISIKHHQSQYPTLSRMARDYLAIQGSAIPLERAFSGGGLTSTKCHNRLNANAFESLQLLKNAYRNGHISAADDATQHLDALIAALEYDIDAEDVPSRHSFNS
jgi:hypothetical protein